MRAFFIEQTFDLFVFKVYGHTLLLQRSAITLGL